MIDRTDLSTLAPRSSQSIFSLEEKRDVEKRRVSREIPIGKRLSKEYTFELLELLRIYRTAMGIC